MEPESSLPHSQKLTTCSYPEPDRTSPYLHPTSLRSILILPSYLRLGLPSGLLPSDFQTKFLYVTLMSTIRATRPAHFILLYLITKIIFGEA